MTPGIHDLPMADYLADPCPEPSLSSGAAHRILTQSPLHVWSTHPRLAGRVRDDSSRADIGTAAHDLLLGGEGKLCVIEPADYRSKPTKSDPQGAIPIGWTNGAIRAARDEARANGLTPILAVEHAAVRLMANTARAFIERSELAGIFRRGRPEQTIIWREGDAWCRARPDWLTDDRRVLLHYKTTLASARPEPFIRGIMASSGYDMAMAFYRRGLEAVGGSTDAMHVMLVQEQEPPHACSLIALDPVKLAICAAKVARAIKLWDTCMNSGYWPDYSPMIHYAEPTPWELAAAERDMQGEQ